MVFFQAWIDLLFNRSAKNKLSSKIILEIKNYLDLNTKDKSSMVTALFIILGGEIKYQ